MSQIQGNANESFEIGVSNENKYRIGMWTGIFVNIFMVIVYISYYGIYCMQKDVALQDLVCYSLVNLCGLVSGCFLGDALRRIYLTFKNLRGLLQNEKIMLLHLILFLIYMVTTVIKTFQFGKWFGSKNKEQYKYGLIMYTVSLWCLFFD